MLSQLSKSITLRTGSTGQDCTETHNQRPFANRECGFRLDFIVGLLWKIHECKADLCTLTGAHGFRASDKHDAEILLCTDIAIADRYALGLGPNDNVRSVLAGSQKTT